MNDSHLSRFLERPKEDESKQCFGQLGANANGAAMLDLRFKTGDRRAFPYAYLTLVMLDKSGTLTLAFAAHRVEVKGCNLERIYSAILEHRVRFLREAEWGEDAGGKNDPFISSLRILDEY